MGYIKLEMQQKVQGQLSITKTLITEGLTLTSFNREDVLFKTFQALKSGGSKAYLKDNMIFQKHPDETKEAILNYLLLKIEQIRKEPMMKDADIKTKVEEVK
jgi:hypothetical protein